MICADLRGFQGTYPNVESETSSPHPLPYLRGSPWTSVKKWNPRGTSGKLRHISLGISREPLLCWVLCVPQSTVWGMKVA